MAASFLASFFIYVIVGLYTLLITDLPIVDSPKVKLAIGLSLFFNAIYYYYYAFHIENNYVIQSALRVLPRRILEWGLRVIALCVLFSLWIALGKGWFWFRLWLVILYISYILWDVLVWKVKVKPRMIPLFICDLCGLILAIFLCIMPEPSKDSFFCLGLITAFYIVISVVGILLGKFLYNFEHTRHFRPSEVR